MNPSRKEHTKKLFSTRFGNLLRVSTLVGVLGLLIFVFALPDGDQVRAAPVVQETPGYDAPEDDPFPTDAGYDAPETETPFPGASPVVDPTIIEPTIEQTPTPTSTLPVDVFRTEDAEINNAQTTPLVSETVGATITPYHTPTATKKPSRATPISATAQKKDGFPLDWGLFWIGFSIPVLGACGVVLYLLDRRPDLFKHGK